MKKTIMTVLLCLLLTGFLFSETQTHVLKAQFSKDDEAFKELMETLESVGVKFHDLNLSNIMGSLETIINENADLVNKVFDEVKMYLEDDLVNALATGADAVKAGILKLQDLDLDKLTEKISEGMESNDYKEEMLKIMKSDIELKEKIEQLKLLLKSTE